MSDLLSLSASYPYGLFHDTLPILAVQPAPVHRIHPVSQVGPLNTGLNYRQLSC